MGAVLRASSAERGCREGFRAPRHESEVPPSPPARGGPVPPPGHASAGMPRGGGRVSGEGGAAVGLVRARGTGAARGASAGRSPSGSPARPAPPANPRKPPPNISPGTWGGPGHRGGAGGQGVNKKRERAGGHGRGWRLVNGDLPPPASPALSLFRIIPPPHDPAPHTTLHGALGNRGEHTCRSIPGSPGALPLWHWPPEKKRCVGGAFRAASPAHAAQHLTR